MRNNFLSILKYSDFKKIWLSQLFSQISLNILTFALILHIYEITGRATTISLVMLASAIPVALIGPFSGVFADKFDYRKILIYTSILRFATAILILFAKDNVLAMLEIIFIISALSQVFTPAESASLPVIVKKKDLVTANSVVLSTTYTTLLVGYSLAGPLLNLIGIESTFLVCSLLFLAATLATLQLSKYDKKIVSKIRLEKLAVSLSHAWDETKIGFSYIKHCQNVSRPIIKLAVGWVVLGAFITLLPAYSREVLDIDPKLVGPLVIGPAGLGMVLAAIYLSRRHKEVKEKLINNGFLIAAISLLIFSLYRYYGFVWGAKIFLFLPIIFLGFGSSFVQIPAQTLLHINSAEDKRGRVFGVTSTMVRLGQSVPAVFVGALADLTSPFVTMVIVSALTLFYAVYLGVEKR